MTKVTIIKWSFLVILVWSLWWLVADRLIHINDYGSVEQFIFWTVSKICIWIVPSVWLLKKSGITLKMRDVLHHWKKILFWGVLVGGIIALITIIPKAAQGLSIFPNELSLSLVNVLIIAPVFEEFICRGALFTTLLRKGSFWSANLYASIFFLALHLPGWYFMGNLGDKIIHPIGGALSVLLLGLAFGYATAKSKSFVGGTVAHFFNNFASL